VGWAQQAGVATGQSTLWLPEIIAHRGASWDVPENTLSSFRFAWAMDADAVEFDIWLSADGQLPILHDRDTQRTGGQRLVVEESTLSQLRQLDYGVWKAAHWRGEPIPTLEEALATRPRHRRMFVESKSDMRVVQPMLEAFDRSPHAPHELVFISFQYDVAAEVKRVRPRTPVYWLEGFRQDPQTGQWAPTMEEVVQRARAANLDGVNLRFVGPATLPENVRLIRDAGLGFYVWTVNDADAAQRAMELGVDGITTDRPAWLKQELLSRNGSRLLPQPQR
jgi:glycerophosphoryl diester phosphodiesterase